MPFRSPFRLLAMLCLLSGPFPLYAQSEETEEAVADTGLAAAHSLLEAAQRGNTRRGFDYQAEVFLVYGQEGDSILLRGHPARVAYKGAELEAAEMVYRRVEDVVEARALLDSSGALYGEPVLKRDRETLRGERILYDLGREQGTILEGRIHREKKHYAGERIRTLSGEEFHVGSGSLSTCDYPDPHFDFYSPRIKVLMDDLAIARPVYFRVKQRRLFWIPFYIFSLRQDRQSGLLTPSFGNRPIRYGDSRTEWELRNLGYYFAPNDYWDLTLSGNLRQRSGWLARMELDYALRYHWNGQLDTQVENRQEGSRTQRAWRVNMRHNQTLSPTASLRASGTFQSNKSFSQDNSSDLQDRLNRTLRSNLSYSKRWSKSGNSLSINASQTKNLDTETFNVVLPEISFRKARKPLWDRKDGSGSRRGSRTSTSKPWYSRIYYDGSARLRDSRRGSSTDTTETTSADLGFRLSSQFKPFSWLQLSPSLNETWRDTDLRRSSARSRRTDQLNGSVALTQTFYGLFHPSIWRVNALRHVLKPNLSLSYQASRADTGGFFGMGGDGSEWKQKRRLNARLDNTFWAKVQRGEEEAKVRLAQLNFSTSYDFEDKQTPLADLSSSLSIAAGRAFDTRLTMRSEFYDDDDQLQLLAPRLKQFELRTSLKYAQRVQKSGDQKEDDRRSSPSSSSFGSSSSKSSSSPFGSSSFGKQNFGYESGLRDDIRNRGRGRRLQLSHYYSRTRSSTRTTTRSWLRASTGFSLGKTRHHDYTLPKWHIDFSLNYDLHAQEPLLSTERVTSELLSIQREFHDWTATFNIEPTRFHRERTFFFKAQLKDIPQIKFERGDSRL